MNCIACIKQEIDWNIGIDYNICPPVFTVDLPYCDTFILQQESHADQLISLIALPSKIFFNM